MYNLSFLAGEKSKESNPSIDMSEKASLVQEV